MSSSVSSSVVKQAFGKTSEQPKVKRTPDHFLSRPPTVPMRIPLDSACWVERASLPSKSDLPLDFEALWAIHPHTFETYSIMGKTVPVPRWQQVSVCHGRHAQCCKDLQHTQSALCPLMLALYL